MCTFHLLKNEHKEWRRVWAKETKVVEGQIDASHFFQMRFNFDDSYFWNSFWHDFKMSVSKPFQWTESGGSMMAWGSLSFNGSTDTVFLDD